MKMIIKDLFKDHKSLNILDKFKFKNNYLSILVNSVMTFFALLMLLLITKLPQAIFQGNLTVNLDELDVAIAMMGCILIFLKKILETMQGKS